MSDLGARDTVSARKGLVDSEGAVTGLGHPTGGSEAIDRMRLGSRRPCSMLGEGKGTWIAQASVDHLGLP